ncbi:MAG: hypothetical protein FJW40_07225 [Acidobacteria bacterium]|nr:hypothetical protein [Acidobacteriota bacterium]
MRRLALLSLAAAAANQLLSGQTPRSGMFQEGGFWVETEAGTLTAPHNARLRIEVPGHLVVRAGTGPAVTYQYVKRVRGASAERARRMMEAAALRAHIQPHLAILTAPGFDERLTAELRIYLPAPVAAVSLFSEAGDIDARGLRAAVEARTLGGMIELDRIEGAAEARTAGGEIRMGAIDGALRAFSGGGTIRLRRATRDAEFESAGGEIFVREALGRVRAKTAGGNIHIDHAGATVEADTGSGSIVVGSSGGADCQTGSGAIRLNSVRGVFRALTGLGQVMAELDGPVISDSFLGTGDGDVVVFLPSNLAVRVEARNLTPGRGRISSEFPEIQVKGTTPVVAAGALNGGGPLLRIDAMRGVIQIRRKSNSR